MGIGKINENKNLKYNHVAPIDLDTIPVNEREQALKEFAEGSIALEKCLRTMWEHGLKTHACCAGEESDYDEAYISMAEGIDIFSFLSPDLLASDMIALENDCNRQVIRFGGIREIREHFMQRVAQDIVNGKKDNIYFVQNKIGKSLNEAWRKESRIYHMRKAGESEDEISFQERGRVLNQILETGTNKEIEKALPEYEEYVRKINERLLEMYSSRTEKAESPLETHEEVRKK